MNDKTIEVAATILSGLLASGEFTEGKIDDSSGYPTRTTLRARPEAVPLALQLAAALIKDAGTLPTKAE